MTVILKVFRRCFLRWATAGLRDEGTQRVLFAAGNLTFEHACKIVLGKDLAAQEAMEMHELDGKDAASAHFAASETVVSAKKQELSQRVQTRRKTMIEGHSGNVESCIMPIRIGTRFSPAVLVTNKDTCESSVIKEVKFKRSSVVILRMTSLKM